MRISGEGKFGILVGLMAMAGTGALGVAPSYPWIGWCLISIAVIGFVVLVYHHFAETLGGRRTLAILLMVVGGVCFFAGAVWYGLETEKRVGTLTRKNEATTQNDAPDVIARFIYPKNPALVLVNRSDKIARQIKWSVAICKRSAHPTLRLVTTG
jgi:predicted membrane channel-forming protein YqfA (hemolysin III family)